jgi:hypothetical protein
MHGTSPLTRNAMRASDLTPNRALRQAIEEERAKSNVPASLAAARGAQNVHVAAPAAGAGVGADAAEVAAVPLRVSIALSAALGDADAAGGVEVLAMTTIAQAPGAVGARVPSDIVLAIDISGSMNAQVPILPSGICLLDYWHSCTRTVLITSIFFLHIAYQPHRLSRRAPKTRCSPHSTLSSTRFAPCCTRPASTIASRSSPTPTRPRSCATSP